MSKKITRKRKLHTALGTFDRGWGETTFVFSTPTPTKGEIKVIETHEVELVDREEAKAKILEKLNSNYKGKVKDDVNIVVTKEELVYSQTLPYGTKDYLDGWRLDSQAIVLTLEVEISFEEAPKLVKKKADAKQKRIRAAEAKLRKAQKELEKLL